MNLKDEISLNVPEIADDYNLIIKCFWISQGTNGKKV